MPYGLSLFVLFFMLSVFVKTLVRRSDSKHLFAPSCQMKHCTHLFLAVLSNNAMPIHCWHACEHPALSVHAAVFTQSRFSRLTKIASFPYDFLKILTHFLAEMSDRDLGNFICRVNQYYSSCLGLSRRVRNEIRSCFQPYTFADMTCSTRTTHAASCLLLTGCDMKLTCTVFQKTKLKTKN